MPTYILVTKLAPEVMQDLKRREELGRQWREKVKAHCPGVKFIAHYAILGHYDFLDIFEASSEEEAAKVSLISLANGALQAETWTAIPYRRFLEIVQELES
ncbi:hypothetical protein HRbin11_00395 [bacterium HR11]|nr:hypothetical protein HRbin11_00395 [bacterium HR11]